ncbi:hypothetical protein ACLB2K_070212 [Fragaria x ananassa]
MVQNHESSSPLKPVIMMVVTQILNTVMNIMYKFVTVTGTNLNVFVAYRLMFSAAFMVPLALILERAALPQNLYILSLALTSPTFLAAINNLMPATTFVVALCFRQEKLTMRNSGIAKMVGTVVGIGGAMLFIFYRGPVFTFWATHIDLLQQYHGTRSVSSSRHMSNPALGLLAGFGSSLCFSLWLVMQGIVISGVAVVVMSWCVQKRGPLFVSIFSPLTLLMVAFASSLLLGENFSLGSVLGGVLIVCGLYMVLWGKSKEGPSPLVLPSLTTAPLISKSVDSAPVQTSVG